MEKTIEKIKTALSENGTFTIVSLGDSVTQGCFEVFMTGDGVLDTVYECKNSYSSRLKELLNLLYPNLRVNMINAGVNGDDTFGALKRLENDVLRFAPDLVIVSYGLNDCALNGGYGVDKYAENLAKIFSEVKASGAECIYLTQNYMNTNVSPFVKEPFLKKLATDFSALQTGGKLKKYYEKGKTVADACGVFTVDLYTVWEKMECGGVNVTEMLSNKLNHPIREYHYYIAVKILEKILGV